MKYKRIPTFAKESGYTEAAIRAKIREGCGSRGGTGGGHPMAIS